MRLGLSTAAVPDWCLDDITAACTRRGLEALELGEGHAHGLHDGLPDEAVRAAGARLQQAGIRTLLIPLAAPCLDPTALRLASLLGAAVILPVGAADEDAVLAVHRACSGAGVRLLLGCASDADAVTRGRRLADRIDCGLSWHVDPPRDGLADVVTTILDAAGPRLAHVRLLGSGPEAAASEGQGIGALLAHLALRGWHGDLTLAPSSRDRLAVWRLWLGRGGWGCGSRSRDDSLVNLHPQTAKVS